MTDELETAKLVAQFVQTNLDTLVDLADRSIRQSRNAVRARLKRTYETYLKSVLDHYSRGKSFFVRSEPVPLYEFFVPLSLSNQKRRLRRAGVRDLVDVAAHAVIVGTGGSGKTMMMRHLLMGAISDATKIPVFIELRRFGNEPIGLGEAIVQTLARHQLEVDRDYINRALAGGHFCIFLDGFDELNADLRDGMAGRMQEFATRYPANWIVVSSRPDVELNSLRDFTQFTVDPLDIALAVDLVRKVPFDPEVKDRFVTDLRNGLFDQHKSFLSNPLLLSIMLLTYTDVAHIPSKLSIFYEQAYDALFQRHDALKGGFQRDRRCGLDIQDFARVFAAFCVLSYDVDVFTFSHSSALAMFDRAKPFSQLAFSSAAVLDDALQAVCLLLEDGQSIVFAHRSFQEYFVAKFISDTADPSAKRKLIERYAVNASRDSVMALLYELDPHSVESYVILPAIAKMRHELHLAESEEVTDDHELRLLQLALRDVSCGHRDVGPAATVNPRDGHWWITMLMFFRRVLSLQQIRTRVAETDVCGQINARGGLVEVSTLTVDDALFRDLLAADFFFAGALTQILDREQEILARHAQAKSSLEELLRPPTRARRPVGARRKRNA
ncbi:MAG: NACHT domain-containing protein [Chloroflexota bacterium]